MEGFGLYLLFLVPPLVLGLLVQMWLKRTFARFSNVPLSSGLSGAAVAREILDRNGLQDVPVEQSPGGALSDHYDPRKRALFLSPPVYEPATVAAAAVAAHETGHALQHASGYVPLKVRSAMYPAVAFASNAWIWLLLAGAFLQVLGLVAVALVLYAVAVLFHVVTLPVEFNASRRASAQLRTLGLVGATEGGGVNKVLNAAAMTYVAGALAALSQLLYYLSSSSATTRLARRMRVRDERDHDRFLFGILELVDALGEDLPDLAHALRRDPHRHLRAAELSQRAELRPAGVHLVEDRRMHVAGRSR